jgi:hypothetical protein
MVDFSLFINEQVDTISSFLVILATSYTHKKLVLRKVHNGAYVDDRYFLDKIDDTHGLYDQVEEDEEKDFKTIIKEEKKKVKILNKEGLKQGIKGSFSLLRLGAYILLAFGFIGLQNNALLNLWYYLPSLMVGIVLGGYITKRM